MNTTADTNEFQTTEIAWFIPGTGKGWKRKVFKTEAALDRFLDTLPSDAIVDSTTDF